MYDSSDSDCLSPMNFQNAKEVIRINGPNIENIMRANFTSNSSLMPHDYERQVREQNSRRLVARRETSPMSVLSGVSGLHGPMSVHSGVSGMHTFSRQRSYYNGSFAQSSVINGRGGRGVSPMSVRSIDSNMSMAATDIVAAFQNGKFNKYEMRNIQDAYNKFMKGKIRKRKAKRRNLKLYMKGARRKSFDDSGDQGSASSLSSDDCRSTYTGTSNRNFNRYLTSFNRGNNGRISDDSRSAKTDITNLKRYLQDSNMYKDCTDSFRQGGFKNAFNTKPVGSTLSRAVSNPSLQSNSLHSTMRNKPTQRDRFMKSFLLPSQRFNNTAVQPILEEPVAAQDKPENFRGVTNSVNNQNNNDSSDSEDILSNTRECFNQPEIQKRKQMDHSETQHSNKKRKMTPIRSNAQNAINPDTEPMVQNVRKNDFEFAKPSLPARKPTKTNKQKKPHIPLSPIKKLEETNKILEPQPVQENSPPLEVQKENLTVEIDQTQNYTSDMSSRPSFIKRKLFTQTMDVTERRDPSACLSPAVSPLGGVYNGVKEKNKTRKLATNQSCLSRDVTSDANLLDLIHKIVPPDQMNATANLTQKLTQKPEGAEAKLSDKWDIESMISNCNNDNVSDTYTDDEIFQVNTSPLKKSNKPSPTKKSPLTKPNELCPINKPPLKKTNSKPSPVKKSPIKNRGRPKRIVHCKVAVQKMPVPEKLNASKTTDSRKVSPLKRHRVEHSPVKINPVKNTVKKSAMDNAHAFWNCDSESDAGTPARPAPLRTAAARPAAPRPALAPAADTVSVAAKPNTTSMVNVTQTTNNHMEIEQNIAEKVKTLGRSTRVKQNDLSNDKTANLSTKAATKTKTPTQTKKPPSNNNEKYVANNNVSKKVLPALKKLITSFHTSSDGSLDSPRGARARNRSIRIQNSMDRTRALADERKKTKTVQKGHNNTTLRTKVEQQSNKLQTKTKNITKVPEKHKDVTSTRAETKKDAVENFSSADTKKVVSSKDVSRNQEKQIGKTRKLATPDTKLDGRKQPRPTHDASQQRNTTTKDRDQGKADKDLLNDTIAQHTRGSLERRRAAPSLAVAKRHTPVRAPRAPSRAPRARDTSDKENERLERRPRQPRAAAAPCKLACCDETPAKTRDIRSFMSKNEEKNKAPPPQPSQKPARAKNDLSLMGLKSTVGVTSRHCGAEAAADATVIDDDARSVTVRSMTSNSLLARGRRPKFLHVF